MSDSDALCFVCEKKYCAKCGASIDRVPAFLTAAFAMWLFALTLLYLIDPQRVLRALGLAPFFD